MSAKPWKVHERKTAKIFGTQRALMKGTGEVKDIGPEDDFPLLVDCKLRPHEAWRISAWFVKLLDAAEASDKDLFPVLSLKEPGKAGAYALVSYDQIIQFIEDKTSWSLKPEDLYHWNVEHFRPKVLLSTWKEMTFAMKCHNADHIADEDKISLEAIPMLSMAPELTFSITVFRPADLARIIRVGGLLENANSQN